MRGADFRAAAQVFLLGTVVGYFLRFVRPGHRLGDIQIAARLIGERGQQSAVALRADRVAADRDPRGSELFDERAECLGAKQIRGALAVADVQHGPAGGSRRVEPRNRGSQSQFHIGGAERRLATELVERRAQLGAIGGQKFVVNRAGFQVGRHELHAILRTELGDARLDRCQPRIAILAGLTRRRVVQNDDVVRHRLAPHRRAA